MHAVSCLRSLGSNRAKQRQSMRRLGVALAALLVVACQLSLVTMAAAQLSPPPPPDEQYEDPPMVGLPVTSPPPGEYDSPESPLPDSPPSPEPETPELAPPTPSQQQQQQPWQAPLPPRREPAPPRTVVPPQEPAWSSTPPPPATRVINYTATGCTTMLVFGDSTVDPGNNNRLQTAVKANFLPYGVNFLGGRPTGRFSNGRLITDILAEKLGIARSIPGFRDARLRSGQLRRGVSFASAGSGYDETTARRSNALSFPNQIEDLWLYKRNLQRLVGRRRAEQLVRRATFVVSAGTTDLLFHYLASNQSAVESGPLYENQLITRVANYTQVMATLGGRRFVFVGVPPIGCLPIVRTLLGTGTTRCHENMNLQATSFNDKLVEVVRLLKNQPDIRATFIDTYTIIGKATINPNNYGLTETSRGCCGTGVIEVGQTCRGRKTCTHPSKYMYWDAAHHTERMNQIITDEAIMNSIGEIYV
ncbi:GDSL esterase/lipase At5g45950-like [Oryza brachyantha]|nr:GDSL esterase/lipase At5g45950-like [Oryza brachyantha]